MREPGNDYSAHQYERPNQPWICGLSETGQSCPAGPSVRGRCPAMSECAPIRSGDRWECNRSQLRGGPCDIGPAPEGGCGRVLKCYPTRSLRTIRGRFVRALAILTVGMLTLVLSANWRDRVLAPGPLARQHSQLLQRTGAAANCAACHSAADQNIAGWTASLVVNHGDRSNQSQLCMKCHVKTISSELAMTAHNVPPELLQRITNNEVRLASTTEQVGSAPSEITCAACHREHHGAQFNLAAMDNAACQSCHRQRYESFATDHPDFGIWPYKRRTRIAFNHASHRDKHFMEKKQSFNCTACHTEDATGKVQLTASYEASCAACHDEKISTSVARGISIFALPTMDVDALRSAGFNIGTWPKGATGDFDGRLPPLMKLLLAADPAAAQAMTKLGLDFDFQDVDPKDRQQLEACAALATAISKLSIELAASADATVRTRLPKMLGRTITDSELHRLVAGLSVDTIRPAVDAWFAGAKMAANPAAPPAQNATATPLVSKAVLKPMVFASAGNWFRDDATFSIRYRPTAHTDPALATWLSLLAETPDLNKRPILAAMFKELTKPNAPGLCASCHTVERTNANELAINWRAYDRTNEPRGFTKFSHGPHLLLPQLANCTHCHAIDSAAGTAAVSTDLDPARFVSDFAAMTKRQCTECHTAKAAGNSCQKCHNYHVESANLLPTKDEFLKSAIQSQRSQVR